ncbi:MAG: DNA polymerase III subunit delta' [Gammaproteobacteria bacterium]|nr:DNA polymerase III subunit delta' [Gammaproteobacteria bacterium]
MLIEMPQQKKHYPWHEQAWQRIDAYQQQQRLPHALLISGVPGLAKKSFAQQLATILLCEKKPLVSAGEELGRGGLGCGNCFSCRLSDLSSHPDYIDISPLEDSKVIKIEEIREVIGFLQQTTHRSGHRVIVISPAEALNLSAANALLKTLEEPPSGCHFLLISHAPSQLSATIRSRCQFIKINPAFDEQTVAWLANESNISPASATAYLNEAEGSPQQALILATSEQKETHHDLLQRLNALLDDQAELLKLAQQWQQQGLSTVLDQLLRLFNQEIRKYFNAGALNNIDCLVRYSQYLLDIKKSLILNPNLNAQLLSESILVKWLEVNGKSGL